MISNEEKKLKLIEIERARYMLDIELVNELILEEDILHLLSVKSDYGFKYKDKIHNYKSSVLRNIFNCPFILCDQEYLSLEIKQVIPILLARRYNMEINELNNLFKEGYITKEEYLIELELIKFCYYESSNDGKSILNKGYIENIFGGKIKTI